MYVHDYSLAPIYHEAATFLARRGSKAKMAEVDCTEHPTICQKYNIEGYPTMKTFTPEGEPEMYEGLRGALQIVQYLLDKVDENEDVCDSRVFVYPLISV